MYKHECYKIFSRKSIYVVLLLIIVLIGYANKTTVGDITLKGETYDDLFEVWGGPVTEEKVNEARIHMKASDAGNSGTKSPQQYAESEVHLFVAMAGSGSEYLQNHKKNLQLSQETISEQSYEHKVVSKELSMLQKLDEPYGFYLIRSWRGMFDFIEPVMTVVFLATLIILGLTPLFVNEYTNRTMDLLLVTKNGKRKIVTAKILAGITYICFVFLLLHVVNFGLQWFAFGGVTGWNAPMQNLDLWSLFYFDESPYAWTVWQFYAVTLTIQFLASIGLGLLVIMLSMIFKNTMMTLLVSGAIVAGPTFIGQFATGNKFFQWLSSYNYVEWIKAAPLFETFQVNKVFGYPLLYPPLLVVTFTVLTLLITIFVYYIHNRTQISN